MKLPSQKVRAYIYRVLCAAGAILLLHGVVTDAELKVYLESAAMVLGFGLASANTPTK